MSAWGAPAGGAWATQVDEEEAANGGELAAPSHAPPEKPAGPSKFVARSAAERALGGEAAFPSLGEAINIKETKADKRKKELKSARQKMTLAEFQAGDAPGGGGGGGGGAFRPSRAGGPRPGAPLGDNVLASLPTAPRARGEGDDSGMGGAFKDYGGDRGGGRDDGRSDRPGRSGGFGDREERRGEFISFAESEREGGGGGA